MEAKIYFYISYPSTKKENVEDIIFIVPEDKNYTPTCIYIEEKL